jgi:hypothetical protein
MQLFGEEHVPPPLFRVDPPLYIILSDVYTSPQAPFNCVKPLHFAKKKNRDIGFIWKRVFQRLDAREH